MVYTLLFRPLSWTSYLVLVCLHSTQAIHSKWESYEVSSVDDKTFDKDLPVEDMGSAYFKSNNIKFRVAILTAGALRSFAYVEKSWRRYIIEPWRDNVHVFAHVLASKHCIVSQRGLDAIRDIAVEVEVGYSSTPLLPLRIVQKKLPEQLKKSEYFRGQAKGLNRGNFFDMNARRIRVYEMARNYAERENFEWDLYVFLRLDSAFYNPVMPLGRIHQGLKNYMKRTNKPAIYIPVPCNFHGACDRIAFGQPNEMEIFFQQDWPFEVLKWSIKEMSTEYFKEGINVHEMNRIKGMMRTDGNSEHMLKCWMVMNNMTQVYSSRGKELFAFVTLRTLTADSYCHMTRRDYIFKHPDKNNFVFDPDKVTGSPDHATPCKELDLIVNPIDRCGPIYTLNSSEICATNECNCGKFG